MTKTAVDEDTIRKVAALSRLHVEDSEIGDLQAQLEKIIGYVSLLEEFDTGLESDWRADTSGPPTPERDDRLEPSLTPEKIVENAPNYVGTSFQVPRIIE